MKKFKRIMALVIALAMVVAMALPVMADTTTANGQTQKDGSITVNSPIIGAEYEAYRIFDMTMNSAGDSFAYTIDTKSPFFNAVKTYADVKTNGLVLTKIETEHVDDDTATTDDESYDKYIVSASEKTGDVEGYGAFNAQTFGRTMQAAITGKLSTINETTGAETITDYTPVISPEKLTGYTYSPNYETGKTVVTADKSDNIIFGKESDTVGTPLPLGYYLITATYPEGEYGNVVMTVPGSNPADKYEFDETALEKDEAGNLVKDEDGNAILTNAAKNSISEYVGKVVTDDYVSAYIAERGLKHIDGTPLTDAEVTELKTKLTNSMQADAEKLVLDTLKNTIEGSEADINVREPILVFLDSTTPDVTINEKNERDKWDVPVNPEGSADYEDVPDHGEPEGGKNIVVREADDTTDPKTPAIYGDWSEAEIGESVHYQLRVNAMNFIRESKGNDSELNQVKEYFLADYQSGQMHYDESKGIKVTIVQKNTDGTETNVTQKWNSEEGKFETVDYLDYSDDANVEKFFKNKTNADAASKPEDVFAQKDNTGIMIPWVHVTQNKDDLEGHPIYTESTVAKADGTYQKWEYHDASTHPNEAHIPYMKHDDVGNLLDENGEKIPATDNYYVYSIYNSDVTIVVDYYMILDDDAIVDEPGNKNYAQYAYNPVERDETTGKPTVVPKEPNDEDKPKDDYKKEVDEATVYTFALAFVKVNNQAVSLKDATFELPFYVKKDLQEGTYVYATAEYNRKVAEINADDKLDAGAKKAAIEALTGENGAYTNSVTTPEDGVITIKGVEEGVYSITETEAPVGYNKMTEPFQVEAKKSGDSVTTTTTREIWLDGDGNITKEETSKVVTKTTDEDSYNNKDATGDEEKTVPVYEFQTVVNLTGTELPSTGGIGTTIFYVVGAILVIGAGVVLITKRRMDA